MGDDIKSQPIRNDIQLSDFSIRVLDRFIIPDEKDSHWKAAIELAEEIGYPVLNIAAVSKYNGGPLWARTTMSETWREYYLTKDYFSHDPFVAHMQVSNEQIVFDCDVPPPNSGLNSKILEFWGDVHHLGYGRFRGIPFNWPSQSVCRIITFGLMAGDASKETEQMVAKARILADVLATRIVAPNEDVSGSVIWPKKAILSEREHELLSFLALGLKNDRIADKCGLAEVTVRKHILSAREKLGASTREQALAIALQNGLINFDLQK